MKFKLNEYILDLIHQQGRTKTWVAREIDMNYKTFIDKTTFNRFTAEELLRLAHVLGIDLNEVKEMYLESLKS